MTRIAAIAFIALPLGVGGWAQGQVRMRAGLWENTVISHGQTATHNACITAAQEESSKGTVESMRASIEKALAKNGSCKLKEFSVNGNTRDETMVCGATSIRNITTFQGDSFETKGTSTNAGVVSTSIMKGRRVGDCPASDK